MLIATPIKDLKMRKLAPLLTILILFVAVTPAFATIYEFTPSQPDLFDLDHSKYYLWGINWTPVAGEEIVSINLAIDDINNWDDYNNILYIHLLERMRTGLAVRTDYQGGGDSIASWASNNHISDLLLDTYTDSDGGVGGDVIDYLYSFSASDIAYFNLFAADGNFGLGFDPDCHYWNSGVRFTIETRAIPEPASMVLFGTGPLGFFFRRRFA